MHPCTKPLASITLSNNGPDSDLVVAEASEESLSISGPSEGDALWESDFLLPPLLRSRVGVVGGKVEVGFEVVNDGSGRLISKDSRQTQADDDSLGFQVEYFDGRGGSSTEPVSVGREDERIDNVTGLERVQVFSIIEIPEHGDTVLATGSGEGSIWRHGKGVDVTSVAKVVGLELALVELPDLRSTSADIHSKDGWHKRDESEILVEKLSHRVTPLK